jgi:hypothetical protein
MAAESIKFTSLSSDEVARLDEQRGFVSTLLANSFPTLHLTRTKSDIAILQKIIDSKVIKKEETWKLQSLGVVFGDALASSVEGLAWCEVTDEYGTDPTLRYRQTTLQINALTMISKRVEEGKEVDLQDMADWVAEFIQKKAANYQ